MQTWHFSFRAQRSASRRCHCNFVQGIFIGCADYYRNDEEGEPAEILNCFKLGVSGYICAPLRAVDILPRIWRPLQHTEQCTIPTFVLRRLNGLKPLIGDSPYFREVINTVSIVARSDVSVHLSGETGTGKELCARAIHYLSLRVGRPFIPVNCGAIPADLVENELFGHVKGAFTGAVSTSDGLLAESDSGTIFFDEIDCLPLSSQVKLLRFLQEKEYRQIGSSKIRKADIRVIAATNVDLDKAVRKGAFRQDLYYRLNIVHLVMPPLRERRGDIPLLAKHFLSGLAGEPQCKATKFTPEALLKLSQYDWPGNVRELENVVRRAVLFSKGKMIRPDEIELPVEEHAIQPEPFRVKKARLIAEFEKNYMHDILQIHEGNITRAARAAGKNRRAFWELIRRHNIDMQKYKPLSPRN